MIFKFKVNVVMLRYTLVDISTILSHNPHMMLRQPLLVLDSHANVPNLIRCQYSHLLQHPYMLQKHSYFRQDLH